MTISTPTPRIYQDVDGVLNATMPQEWGKTAEGNATTEGHTYKIRWAPALVEALNKLPAEHVWTTTWTHDGPAQIAPLLGLSLPSRVLMPVGGLVTFPSIEWKLEAIVTEQLANPSKFVWFEDEVNPLVRGVAVAFGGYAPYINPRVGITPKHIELAKRYLGGEENFNLWR